jgi:DNA-binding transcriptional LysR family regulator
VTRAAKRLGLSQPALSASLGRLRRHFDDPLLTRTGNTYQLTPLAVQLRRQTPFALAGVERVFRTNTVFDPRSANSEFTVCASDYAMAMVGGVLTDLVSEQAPGVRIRLQHHDADIIEHASDGLRMVDALLQPHGYFTDLPHVDVYDDEWVCLVARSNRHLVNGRLTMTHLAELPWVFTFHGRTTSNPAARQLQTLGIEPHVHLVVESFLALPFFIAGSDRLSLVQRRLVPRLTAAGDVQAVPVPFEADPLVEALWWHPIRDGDPEHEWLRGVFQQVAVLLARHRPSSLTAARPPHRGKVQPLGPGPTHRIGPDKRRE